MKETIDEIKKEFFKQQIDMILNKIDEDKMHTIINRLERIALRRSSYSIFYYIRCLGKYCKKLWK